MKKKIIATVVAAVLVLTGSISVIFALNGSAPEIYENETGIIYDPVTELKKTVVVEGGLDFSASAFKVQHSYYSSTGAFSDAKNYSNNTIGGTSVGGPNNWTRYCAFKFTNDSSVLTSRLVTSNGKNRLVFTAPTTGEYTIVPSSINGTEGVSLSLSVSGGIEGFGENNATFTIFDTRTNKTVFTKTLDAATTEANISQENGENIKVFLSAGDELYFETTISKSWHDVNNDTVSVKTNFVISLDESTMPIETYPPAEFIEGAANETGVPNFYYGIMRADTAYYSDKFLPMSKVVSDETTVTVGDMADHNNWQRYCSFVVEKDDSFIVSKMATGTRGSGNRLVFMAPETGYYEIKPRGLEDANGASVKLSLGDYAEDFGENTATFKAVNPQTNETYSEITLFAANESGESRLTGEIATTENIYLRKGEKLFFITSTSVNWFDKDYKQTVSLYFDFDILYREKASIQRTYSVSFLPGLNFGYDSTFTANTKYLGGEWKAANCARRLGEGYSIIGDNENFNWDKYAAFEADNQGNRVISKLLGSGSENELVFEAPADGVYSIAGSSVSLELGNYADKFSEGDTATLIITSDFAEAENFSETITLSKQDKNKVKTEHLSLNLKEGDKIRWKFSTTANWFDNPEYQTVSVVMDLLVSATISTDKYEDIAVFNPADSIRNVALGVPSLSSVATGEDHIINYEESNFKTFNQYYSLSHTEQYATKIGGEIWTYGYTYENGSEGRTNQLQRGSFKIGGEGDDLITGVMAVAGEAGKQTLTFIAPEKGLYAINPKSVSYDETAWIKSFNNSLNDVKGKLYINQNNEIDLFESEEIGLGGSQVTPYSIMVYLDKGEELNFDFVGLTTTWNTDLRLGVCFDISLISKAN